MRTKLSSFLKDEGKLLKYFSGACVFILLLAVCPYTYAAYQTLLPVSLAFGVLMLAKVFLLDRSIYRNRYFPLLFLFTVSYAVTILLNARSHFFKNCGQLAYTCLYLFIFFCAFSMIKSTESRREILRFVMHIVVGFALVISLVSLWMLVIQYRGEYACRGTMVPIGLNNRVYSIQMVGIGTSSSILGGMCVSALLSSILLLRYGCRKLRWFYVLSAVIQWFTLCAANAFTDMVMVMTFAFMLVLCTVSAGLYTSCGAARRIQSIMAVFLALVAALCVFAAYFITEKAEAKLVNRIEEIRYAQRVEELEKPETPDTPETPPEEPDSQPILPPKKDDIKIERDLSTSVSSGRLPIWREGVKLFMKHPLGTTESNIEVFIQHGNDPHYSYTNLHNGFLTLLVAAGIIGFLLIMIFGVQLLVRAMAHIFAHSRKELAAPILLVSASASILSMDIANGCFVLWRGNHYLLLWLFLGELYALCAEGERRSSGSFLDTLRAIHTWLIGGEEYASMEDFQKRMDYLRSFPEPKDIFERSYDQFLCQRSLYRVKAASFLENAAAATLQPILTRRYLHTRMEPVPVPSEKPVAVFWQDSSFIPEELEQQYEVICDVPYNIGCLKSEDLAFVREIAARYPKERFFAFKILCRVATYRAYIELYHPAAILSSAEYSFTSSALTEYCRRHSIRHINIQHGERNLGITSSFCAFDTFYVWNDFFRDIYEEERFDMTDFRIARPPVVDLHLERFEEKTDLKYYLQLDRSAMLRAQRRSVEQLIAAGYRVTVRFHPGYCREAKVRRCFGGLCPIESPFEVPIAQSLGETRGAVGAFTAVLYQAYENHKLAVVDDLYDPTEFQVRLASKYALPTYPGARLLSELLTPDADRTAILNAVSTETAEDKRG